MGHNAAEPSRKLEMDHKLTFLSKTSCAGGADQHPARVEAAACSLLFPQVEWERWPCVAKRLKWRKTYNRTDLHVVSGNSLQVEISDLRPPATSSHPESNLLQQFNSSLSLCPPYLDLFHSSSLLPLSHPPSPTRAVNYFKLHTQER